MSNYDNSDERSFGLWPQTSKKGTPYWRFYDKGTGETFTLFKNDSDNPKAPAYKLIHKPIQNSVASSVDTAVEDEDLPF